MIKKATSVTTPRHIDRLYKAVLNYVNKSGGNVDFINGVQIQEWANGNPNDFIVAIRCSGDIPEFAKPQPPTPNQIRETCIEILKSGKSFIEAIKYYRSVAKVGLRESKDYIDSLRAEEGL